MFNFDKWHLTVLSDRKYAQDIITYLNSLPCERRSCIAEIGVGLGDITRNLHFKHRIGYDKEENVLKAAKLISKLTGSYGIKYQLFNFPETTLDSKFTAIILVNWIHHIPPDILKQQISLYYNHNLFDDAMIIIDTVQDKEYKFNHSIDYLTSGLNASVVKIGTYERQREVYCINKP